MQDNSTVDSAVESMKHGALDVMQKPFSVEEVRSVVQKRLDPGARTAESASRYEDRCRRARALIREGSLDAALAHLQHAVEASPDGAEAQNLIGVIEELRHNRPEAQRRYRTALELDPTYAPARENLEGSMRDPVKRGRPSLGGFFMRSWWRGRRPLHGSEPAPGSLMPCRSSDH